MHIELLIKNLVYVILIISYILITERILIEKEKNFDNNN
jgi:hypothetical protein